MEELIELAKKAYPIKYQDLYNHAAFIDGLEDLIEKSILDGKYLAMKSVLEDIIKRNDDNMSKLKEAFEKEINNYKNK